jgi:hypothetical protein
MASPRLYFYPDSAGSLETIDLVEALSDLQETHAADVEDAYTGSGTLYRSFSGASMRVRIVLERFGTRGADSVERDLQSLVTHLQRGGAVGFARDHAKAWCGVTASAPTRGDVTLYTNGSGFTSWSASAAPVAGDEIAIETPSPDYIRELRTCGTLTVSPPVNLPLASGVRYTYSDSAVVRHRDFYPVLRLPRDLVSRTWINHDHRRNFTLDLTLEYSPADVLALWGVRTGGYRMYGAGSVGSLRSYAAPGLRGAGALRAAGGASMDELLSGALPMGGRASPTARFTVRG